MRFFTANEVSRDIFGGVIGANRGKLALPSTISSFRTKLANFLVGITTNLLEIIIVLVQFYVSQ